MRNKTVPAKAHVPNETAKLRFTVTKVGGRQSKGLAAKSKDSSGQSAQSKDG